MKFNEQVTIENYIIKFIKDKLGFEYIKPEEFAKLRDLESEYVIKPQLFDAVKRINKVDDTVAKSILREVSKIDSNKDFLDAVRNGINLMDPTTRLFRDYKIVDLDNLENNQFVVTNQFYFEGDTENIRPDVMVFVNGLSLVLIEAKSPTASENVSFENGIDQIKRYEKVARKLFIPNCFNIASDGLKTVYGATGSPKQYFLQWRDDELVKELSGELEMTLFSLLSKKNFLDIVQNFILFEKEKEKLVKKIARYQQMRATNKIVERVVTKEKRQGLIWHTQGSGKTLTMYFTAWKLRFNKQLANPKVFILVDRVDLDDQIFETFTNAGGKTLSASLPAKIWKKKYNHRRRVYSLQLFKSFLSLATR